MLDKSKVELWNGALEYLKKSRAAWWNNDYIEFLIDKVWKIKEPVSIIDFGCGIGFLGELLLPLLPNGSTYTGVDIGDRLLEEAADRFKNTNYETHFIHADLCSYVPENKYDIAICQTVLQHIPNAVSIVEKMKDSVKAGGMVISIDVSRDTASAALFIDGLDYGKINLLGVEQKIRRNTLDTLNKDFEIGLKTPILMKNIGLKNVGIRMNDFVQFVNPEDENYKEQYKAFISEAYENEYTEEMKDGLIKSFMCKGLTFEEAEKLFYGKQEITSFVQKNKDSLYAVSSMCMFISYGIV